MSLTSRFPSLKPAFAGNHRLVGLFFASAWCPDCVPAVGQLKALYESQQPSAPNGLKDIEIIYISSDKSKDEMEASIVKSHAAWRSIPFENALERDGLKQLFSICAATEAPSLQIARRVDGIPSLVILDAETQEVLTTNGMSGLLKYGPNDACQVWLSKKELLLSQGNKHSSKY